MAFELLEPHFSEHIIFQPFTNKETQTAKLIGKKHVARFMWTILLIKYLRNVGECTEPKSLWEISRPDRLKRLLPLNLINIQRRWGSKQYLLGRYGPDMEYGLISSFWLLKYFLLGQNVINSELKLNGLELSVLIQNVIIVTDCNIMIVGFDVDDHLLTLWILCRQVARPHWFHVLLVQHLY